MGGSSGLSAVGIQGVGNWRQRFVVGRVQAQHASKNLGLGSPQRRAANKDASTLEQAKKSRLTI